MFPRAPLPERIGPYTVLRRLPSTGGADRYLGREDGPRGFTRMVELKLAPAEEDPEIGSELAHEASVVSRLNHPYISRMYHFFEHEGRLVLVLERLEGTTLARVLSSARRRRQRLPDEVVYYVAHRLVSAVAHAHKMVDDDDLKTPVVHRAISPAALQIGWGGEVRLAGFGLAKIMGRSPDTAVGLVKGTPGYMAPEQLRGERITERTDVYQAGLIIWEMLSGNPPATAGTPQKSRQAELVMMMSGPELASVSVLRPSVPREIAAVIDAMLEPSVEKRKISAAEVERWLAKTVDVESGKEMLRERAVVLRGQDVRDSTSGAEPVRMPAAARRATLQRREGESSATFSIRRAPVRPGEVAIPTPTPTPSPVLASAPPPALTPAPPVPAPAGVSRVTVPDMEPGPSSAPSQEIPVEGERGATTMITNPQRTRQKKLIAAGIAGVIVLGGAGALVVARLAQKETPAPGASAASAVSSEAPPPPPPVVSSAPPIEAPPTLPDLGPRQGALLVRSSEPGNVYVNGARSGETDKVLVVTCGPRYIRVGSLAPVGGRVRWLTPGASVKLPCGVLTEVDTRGGR